MSKFLYRIEHHEQKIGVYNCPVKYDGLSYFFTTVMRLELGNNFCGDYHRNPRHDGLAPYMSDSARYGFCSLGKLKKWFGSDAKTYALFAEYGFVLRRFKVENRFDSDRQSIAMIEEMVDGVEISFDRITKTK